MEYIINQVRLCGTLDSAPVFSHENHGRQFYSFFLAVERLSGTLDRLRVLADQSLLREADCAWGERVLVTGQVRSYNQVTETGRHLIISVLAASLELSDEEPDDRVTLTGTLCRDPVYRRTPLGREICDGMLAVSRSCRRSDYLPCIFWGRTARQIAGLTAGARITLTGRLQSREYVKVLPEGGTERRTAYDISAVTAELTRD